MKLRCCISLILCLYASLVMAQTGTVSGRIQDATDGKALPLATITIFRAADTSLLTYRLSDQAGAFRLNGLPLQVDLRMVVTFAGYDVFRKEFRLTEQRSFHTEDSILLKPTSMVLDDVVVFAERPPVVVRNDTIEFNARSFRTLPNAVVEDLLKRLPGVMVDDDGNITVNGKPVNRILVDGKTFFGDDPRMATRNLPANIIDKVQVTDDQEELQRRGDDNLNNVGKVVNITLKKGVKKSWFGKAYAGAGSDQRHEAGMIANIFRDTLQISLLGYTNNLNRPGFSMGEIMQSAGFSRSNDNLMTRTTSSWRRASGGSGMAINGVNFGGMRSGGGVAASKGLGVNLNHAPDAKRSLFAQYFYGNITVDKKDIGDVRQYNGDTIVQQHAVSNSDFLTNAHRVTMGGKFKPDSVTTIFLNLSYMAGSERETSFRDIVNDHNILGALSNGAMQLNNRMNTYGYEHAISFTRLSRVKRNRRFSIFHSLNINNRFNDLQTRSQTQFLYPTRYDSALNQLRREAMPTTDVLVSFNYSEPLGKGFTLRMGGRLDMGKQGTDIHTFLPSIATSKYDSLHAPFSSRFKRNSNRGMLSTGLEYRWKQLVITPMLRMQYQSIKHDQVDAPLVSQQLSNLLPAFSLQYKQLTFNYLRDVQLPSSNYLIPVLNNSDPYQVSTGNAQLLPAQRHQFALNYFNNNPTRNSNFFVQANMSLVNNDVVQNIVLNDKGIQTSTPVNADGTRQLTLQYEWSKQYKNNPNRILTWRIGGYYNLNRGQLWFNGKNTQQRSNDLWHSVGLNLNLYNRFEWNNAYGLDHSFTTYGNNVFPKLSYVYHSATTEFIVRMPKHVIWETKMNYAYNGSIVTPNFPKSVWRWSAGLNLTMLKEERGVLKFAVNDILNKNVDIAMNVNRNKISTNNINVLGRYFLVTFTYNIRG